MEKLKHHIISKCAARLIIVASILCICFGNGVHIHAVFDHIFDHGDVHVIVHSHSDDHSQGHNHTSESDDLNTHNHPAATVDLAGTMIQTNTNKTFDNSDIITAAGVLNSYSISETPIPLFLDLPPPDYLYQTTYFPSYSLRGPPMG